MTDRQPTSRSCFVCGRDNPLGLKTRWVSDAATREVRTQLVIPEHFNGYPGVVHGGIITALLDEAMVRTLLVDGGFDDMLVTAKLEMVFRRPTPTETPVTAVARLLKRVGNRAIAEAELRLADGTVTARAEATMAKPPADVAAGWEKERPFWKVDHD
ncbi:MAG TPA: PaaI family thioesterase [Anaeromyxobacteraceae bacterium]|nr:PaaI family thioesterase [Anaeromyxobacteraceae bacterium]